MSDSSACPACGGSGGGPFGPRGSAWDVESYECPRCQGAGVVSVASPTAVVGHVLAKAAPPRAERAEAVPARVAGLTATKR